MGPSNEQKGFGMIRETGTATWFFSSLPFLDLKKMAQYFPLQQQKGDKLVSHFD